MSKSIFQTYRDRLVDLSTKNKSLYLSKTENSGILDLKGIDFLNGENSFEIIRTTIFSKKKSSLLPQVDPRISEVNVQSKTLSRISFRDQLIQEETGEHTLFLAWPFVEGKLINGQILRAPLLLLGVKLSVENESWQLKPEDNWQWNPAFILAYNQGYKKSLDADELNSQLSDFSKDSVEFRVELAKMLEENFAIQLSSSLFEDQITTFPVSSRSVDDYQFKEGKLTLKTYALLGQFAQKSSFLFRDYEKLDSQFGAINVEDLFEKYFAQDHELPVPQEHQLFPVFPLDASQEQVLIKVRQGKSLVVEGPPGTGKSQLIANLVSDYCSRGKKVLVVSQKRAALDVVFERLADAGFGDFLALVHDYRADQNGLFQKVKSQIESIDTFQEVNRGIDAIQLEREISVLSRIIITRSEKFEELRTALFDTNSAGISIKELYLKANLSKVDTLNSKELITMKIDEARDFERNYRVYHQFREKFQNTFWEKRSSFSHLNTSHFGKIASIIKEITSYEFDQLPCEYVENEFVEVHRDIISGKIISTELANLAAQLKESDNPNLALGLAFDTVDRKVLKENSEQFEITIERLKRVGFTIPDHIDLLIKEQEIYLKQEKHFLSTILFPFKKKQFIEFDLWLQQNHLDLSRNNISLASDALTQLLALRSELENLPKIIELSVSLDNLTLIQKHISDAQIWSGDWKRSSVVKLKADWSSIGKEPIQLIDRLETLERYFQHFKEKVDAWKTYFTPDQILALMLEKVSLETQNLNQDLSDLIAFDSFQDTWGKLELAALVYEHTQQSDIESHLAIFRNSWRIGWIDELERRNPILSEAGNVKLGQEMNELKSAILEKRKLSKFVSQLHMREQATDELEFNRLGNRMTYRDLLHQVSKKRQKWPIRKLISEFSDEIFRLLPCWLASPETVSALFPSDQSFDLVIFDEASQCEVERGIPAMLRGKQVVVAGDSKQLRPSDFYQVKIESDEEGLQYEAESLLELSSSFFEKYQLKGHYRSADPALIHFSNTHFYGSKLETLPDYQTVLVEKPAFSWEKVSGVWENKINKSEAEAVLEKVKVLLSKSPNDTIGIVTGNYFQMELIREKLWKAGFQDANIKVRNIENVQGDEFDQVILSLGYAPNQEGKLVTNFGLVGKSGAENRLNVAITRARKMMHVISSIEPDDFRPGQLKNPGLVLLKEFLTFVQDHSKGCPLSAPESSGEGFEIDWSLKKLLINQDKTYSNEIPSSLMDLIKIKSSTNKLAILTDDQRFFNATTAKAAVGYHPILLEQKGWAWEWKWSRGFFIQKS